MEKEEQEGAVLEGYVGGLSEGMIGAEVVRGAVEKAAEGGGNMGEVLKRVLGPGGSLDGKVVERGEVARLVKEALGRKREQGAL